MSTQIALDPAAMSCPLCGNTISTQEYARIQARIAEQERKKLEGVRKEAEKKLAAIVAERDAREVAIRKQAAAEAEARAKSEAGKKLATVIAERDQGLARLKGYEAAEQQHKKDLEQQRLVLEKDRDAKLLKLQAQHGRENAQLQQKMDAMNRRLQRKTADDLGEGAEVDVYDALRDAFPRDVITRVKRGQPGADIRHEVVHKGSACGSILLDSKNRQSWQSAYLTKLREDQVAGKAEYAVLATTAFPAGKRDLFVDAETRVIVVSPVRVVDIVGVLRTALVQIHVLKLSASDRTKKHDLLYEYITSEDFQRHQSETGRIASELLNLDVDEKRGHDQVWAKRGKMVTRLRNVTREIDSEISAILEDGVPGKRARA